MIRVIDADFKQLDNERAAKLAEIRPKLDLNNPDDREFLERIEQQYYAFAMMDVAGPHFRQTPLRSGDDWRTLWKMRKSEAIEIAASDPSSREALEAAFELLQGFADERDARIIERVVKASFGGEPAWILLVHWEREDAVYEALKSGKEALLGHFLIIGVRWSDRKLVARIQCG